MERQQECPRKEEEDSASPKGPSQDRHLLEADVGLVEACIEEPAGKQAARQRVAFHHEGAYHLEEASDQG